MQTHMLHICGVLSMNAFMLGFCFLALSLLPRTILLCCEANLFCYMGGLLNPIFCFGQLLWMCIDPLFRSYVPKMFPLLIVLS